MDNEKYSSSTYSTMKSAPDYERLRLILEEELGRSVSSEEALDAGLAIMKFVTVKKLKKYTS